MKRTLSNLLLTTSVLLAGSAACGGGSKDADTTPAQAETEGAPGGDQGGAGGAAAGGDQAPSGDGAVAAPRPTAADQLARGEKVYADSCASCHGEKGEGRGKKSPAVVGAKALKKYKTAGDLYSYVKAKMPKDDPGSLSDDDYLAVTAWTLSKNGKASGDQPLTVESATAVPLN